VLSDTPESGDHLGRALGAGDFDDDGDDELVIGVYSEDLDDPSGPHNSGAMHILVGASSPLQNEAVFWDESAVLPGSFDPEQDDEFGKGFDAADYNGDGCEDLIVGSYQRSVGGVTQAGVAYVVYGSSSGLNLNLKQLWYQGTANVEDDPSDYDQFGWQFG
jgi:hypothetical protein